MKPRVLAATLALVASTALLAAGVGLPAAAGSPVSSIDKGKAMSGRGQGRDRQGGCRLPEELPDQAPGLWLAVWDPKKGYYEQAYGQAVVGGAKATVADHFMIGSITKTVMATAVLQQVAVGKLRLTRHRRERWIRRWPRSSRRSARTRSRNC